MSRVRLAALLACAAVAACGRGPSSPSDSPPTSLASIRIEGEWRGTTDGGTSITVTVSPARRVTRIVVEYRGNRCVGGITYANLDLPTANMYDARTGPPQFEFSSDAPGAPARTVAFGTLSSEKTAFCLVSVSGHTDSGNESIGGAWTASRP
jgi:hypothetical protein